MATSWLEKPVYRKRNKSDIYGFKKDNRHLDFEMKKNIKK